jgi:hypothetical protein
VVKRASRLADNPHMHHHHHPDCGGSDKRGCNCRQCNGSRHGIRTGAFADKAKRRLTNQITADVAELNGRPRARRTREIRDVLANDAGGWLATVACGDTRGAVVDDLAEAISDALTSSGARLRLGQEHLICEIYTQLYIFRDLLEQAVAVGIEKVTDQLIDIIGSCLDEAIPGAAAARPEFVGALRSELTDMLARRLVTVVLAHAGYPTPRQLAELIMLSCPDPTPVGHPDAARAVLQEGIPAIIDAANQNP